MHGTFLALLHLYPLLVTGPHVSDFEMCCKIFVYTCKICSGDSDAYMSLYKSYGIKNLILFFIFVTQQ